MSLSINNNITSLNAWRNLKQTDSAISKTMEKLSSGLRINRAADDPAGLVISEKMRAQLNGLDTAVKNSEKAINMVQTAEASLDKVGKLLVKIRQLAIDSANAGVNDSSMLAANQSELDEAVASITRIADYTVFGTKKLLNGEMGVSVTGGSSVATGASFDLLASTTEGNDTKGVTLTVTAKATAGKIFIGLKNITGAAGVISAAGSLTIDGVGITVTSTATGTSIKGLIEANDTLSSKYSVAVTSSTTGSSFGITLTNKLTYGTSQAHATVLTAGNSIAVGSAISSTDGVNLRGSIRIGTGASITMSAGNGLTLADTKGNRISLTSTGNAAITGANGTYGLGAINDNSAVFQIGAMESQQVSVSIRSTQATSLGKYATYGDSNASVTTFKSISELTTSGNTTIAGVFKNGSADQLAQAIGVIDQAIEDVATIRGSLGAVQSDNLQVQLDSLRVSYENLQASESTIRDVDMTSEMANFTKYQIMMQAGTAMLAQANQQPNNLLTLLK